MRLHLVHDPSGPSPRPATLEPLPASNVGFRERAQVCILRPPGPGWTFTVDDEPLEGDGRGWRWSPGFYAGEVTAQLLDEGGRTVAEYLLDVAPDDRKLGRERFRALFDEVWAEDPALIVGAEPATVRSGRETRLDHALAALLSFARLRAFAPSFLRALDEAAKQPRTAVRRVRTFAPAHRVKRVDLATARSLARSSALAASESASFERLIDVPLHEAHFDCAANRCLVAIGEAVRARVRAIRSALAQKAEREESSATRTSLSSRWPHRAALLDGLEAALTRRLRQEPWRSVRRPEVTAAGLNAVAADPLYARAYQQGWWALGTGVGGAALERLWLSPTWELFERWCFLRVKKACAAAVPGLEWRPVEVERHPAKPTAGWRGVAGALCVEVLLQPCFPSWDQPAPAGFRSVSRQRFPDIVVTWEREGERGFVVFDAKYRQGRQAELEEMAVAHVYRDSLRWHGLRPVAAVLVVPAEVEAGWLAREEFWGEAGVGIVTAEEGLSEVVRAALGGC